MKKIAMLAALFALVLAGCGGQSSNLDVANPDGRIMYPITAEEADGVLLRAIYSTLPGAVVTAVAAPNRGYLALESGYMDRHRYTATAVPTVGIRPDGTRVNGYAFAVSDFGTIISRQATYLFQAINLGVATLSAPLPVASN